MGELTEYEQGYLDGMLASVYRYGGELVVGRDRITYERAATKFLHDRGHTDLHASRPYVPGAAEGSDAA